MSFSNFMFLIVGRSGSGKTTLAEALCHEYGWSQIQSYTTRPPRYEGEKGHIFVSDEEFNKLENLVAYTEFNGYRYCATEQQVNENDIYVIDPAGVRYFAEHYKGDKQIVLIYLRPRKLTVLKRMLKRGDKLLTVIKRFIHDEKVFENVNNMPLYLFFDCSDILHHLGIMTEESIDEMVKNIRTGQYPTYSMYKEENNYEI